MKKSKMGAPKKPFDWSLLDSYLTLRAPLDFCCEKLLEREGREVSAKSIAAMRKRIERRIRERFECTFVQYRDQKIEPIRQSVLRKQIEVAMAGNATMLIWLGKQLLGQVDSNIMHLREETQKKEVQNLSDQELAAMAEDALRQMKKV